jgi:hypothetical protein
MFGNPKAVERAIEAAVPNIQKVKELRDQQQQFESSVTLLDKEKKRVVKAIAKGTITDDEAKTELDELRKKSEEHRHKLQTINAHLDHLPSAELVRSASNEVAGRLQRALFPARRHNRKIGMIDWSPIVMLKVSELDDYIGRMSWEDKRGLMELVFAGTIPDGRRAGVYVEFLNDKNGKPKWRYSIRGHISKEQLRPSSVETLNQWRDEDDSDSELCVTKCA